MTVYDLMSVRGFLHGGGKKCRCPSGYHADINPSAVVNDNSVYCFSCHKTYGIQFLEKKFGVRLEKVVSHIDRSGVCENDNGVLFREP